MSKAKTDSQVSTLDDESPASEAAVPKVAAVAAQADGHDATLSGRKMLLNISPGIGKEGREAVPVGLNGRMYLIPRGTPCEVPEEVVEVLNNAVETRFVHEGKEIVPMDVRAHTYVAMPVATPAA